MTEEAKKTVDLKITPEMEEKLNRYRGYLPGSILTWTPDFFKGNFPKSEWPLFKYRTRGALDIACDADDLAIVRIAGVTTSNANERLFNITRRQTVDFKNYKNRRGDLIACEKDKDGVITEECWKKISFDFLQEYMSAINDESHLSDEEVQGLGF